MNQRHVMHLLWAFMTMSNRWSNGEEDITQVKAPIYNALAVTNENESRDLLLIKCRDGYKVKKKAKMAIMSESNSTKRYTHNSHPKNYT